MAVETYIFGRLQDGTEVPAYKLTNGNGTTLEVLPYGCRVIKLLVPDKNGNLGDVVLGHKTLPEYFGGNYQGSFVGRYANRIGKAEFPLNGKTYHLSKNDGNNTLHGGPGGYHQVLWDVKHTEDGDEPSIIFSYTSPDGDEGYPGKLCMTVTYRLTLQNELVMLYHAESDSETVFNPTNHSFFNLSGDFGKTIYDTELTIHAAETTAVSDDLIPTGELLSLAGTPLDFSVPKKLGVDMCSEAHTVKINGGFDHNYCVPGSGCRLMAEAYEPESGRVMAVYSDMPGIQLYTFNSVSGLANKDGSEMKPHTAFCLETQFYPDSPNHPAFPFQTLKPGEQFESKTVYQFSCR